MSEYRTSTLPIELQNAIENLDSFADASCQLVESSNAPAHVTAQQWLALIAQIKQIKRIAGLELSSGL